MVAVAVAPLGATTVSGASPSDGQEHRCLGPAGGAQRRRTSADRPRRPPRRRARRAGVMAAAMPRRAGDADHAGAVGAHAGGDRRALRAAAHDVLAAVAAHAPARPCSSARRRATAATSRVDLAAERPAVGERRRRFAARRAPRGVGLEVAGLDPGRLQRAIPVARRAASIGQVSGAVERRPWHLAGQPSAPRVNVSPTCHVAVGAAHGDERIRPAPCRRRSRRVRARHPARRPGACRPRARPAARRACPSDVAADRRDDPKDRTASTIGCQPVQRHRWAARARWTASATCRAAASGRRRA